jgi:dynein light chain 4
VGKWEQCARGIKESLDRKFGQTWHVCVGEGFGFNVTHQAKNMLYLYYGHVGVVCFKC